jgi:hypothetical protein
MSAIAAFSAIFIGLCNGSKITAVPRRMRLARFSLGTLRQWEQGRRSPEGPARVLLTVISHRPEAVTNALETEVRKVAPSPKQRAIG